MLFTETRLKGAFIVDIDRREDDRGFFGRVFCQKEFEDRGLEPNMVQASAGRSIRRGTLRGMHFQFPPAIEAKLVHCMSGAVLDVIVDLRPESPTYLQHVAVELSSDNLRALYVPGRFAHGYQTLQDDATIVYHASAFYAPSAESGLRYDDPQLAIAWPLPVSAISRKDRDFQLLDDIRRDLTARMSMRNTPAAPAVAA
jgi:dTDP-4-dehydrorhamnose 3,5-epimerase